MVASIQPLRIAVDLASLRPGGENGGVKPFLIEALRWLGRQQRAPLQFVYLTNRATHNEVRDGLARTQDELVCVDPSPGAALLWELGVELLYCPFGAVTWAWPDIPTVCAVVDVLHRDFPESLEPAEIDQREKEFRRMLEVADALQCISVHVMHRLETQYGVPSSHLFPVYIVIHARLNAGPVRSHHTPFFFYPANAWKHKNHEVLLDAYARYRAAAQAPWPLFLTGHEDARWERLREAAQGQGGIHMLGYVSDQELAELWQSAGALVFPSLHEGFGIPLLEAMEHDVPIISSPAGSLAEVGGPDACLYVDPRDPAALANAMAQVAGDAALRGRLIAAGRRRLADFSLDLEMDVLLDALLVAASRPPVWRPAQAGIFPDGWTQGSARLALPDAQPGQLRLRFWPMPAPRQLRLTAGRTHALGSYDLPAGEPAGELLLSLRSHGGRTLQLEIPDAANLNPADGRTHGVRLLEAHWLGEDGAECNLLEGLTHARL